ncbi:MAG: hypothetical protein KJO13_11975 [Gammaproteobacteria bacterium]|nr:hypothetical protein [Gammaproteobacteria bacterium]
MFNSLTVITRIAVIAVFASLGACASSPSYVAADGANDYGHHSRKIAENRYRVNFNGNRNTSYEETRDYALLRAAELTLAEGNDWFQVVDRESQTTETNREPESRFGYQRAYYVSENCNLVSCSRSVRPAAWTTMDIDARRPDTKHTHSLEIVMGQGEMPDDGHFYDAREVVRAIYQTM